MFVSIIDGSVKYSLIYSIYCQPTQPSLKQPKSIHKGPSLYKVLTQRHSRSHCIFLPPVRVMLRCPSKSSSASTQQGSPLAPGVLVPWYDHSLLSVNYIISLTAFVEQFLVDIRNCATSITSDFSLHSQ